MPIICIFGDSTAWGAWDTEKGGWVNRLWLYCSQNNREKEIYNLSISGGTTDLILQRFESEAKVRGAEMIIFQSGGNDSAYDKDTKEYLISIEKFEKNIEEIIQKAKSITSKIVFVGFTNCDEAKTTPQPWCNLCYENENIKKYNNVMKNVCEMNQVKFIDTFGLLNIETDLDDGLHPSPSGHQKIFEKVKEDILEYL